VDIIRKVIGVGQPAICVVILSFLKGIHACIVSVLLNIPTLQIFIMCVCVC
jgi:hypothetical protein